MKNTEVYMKLAPGADRHQVIRALKKVVKVQACGQVFPEEKDPDLTSIYIIKIDFKDIKTALRHLSSNPSVEYAEEVVFHKLIQKEKK